MMEKQKTEYRIAEEVERETEETDDRGREEKVKTNKNKDENLNSVQCQTDF